MKKMLPAVIFIIIVFALVLAGCVTFTTELPGMDTSTDESDYSIPSEDNSYYIDPALSEYPAGETLSDGTVIPSEGYSQPVETQPGTPEQSIPTNPNEPATQVPASEQPATQAPAIGQPATQAPSNEEPATHAPAVPSTSKNEPATQKQEENSTKKNSPASRPETTAYVPGSNYSSTNGYDAFRNGNFYAKGSLRDSTGTQPMEMAITDNSIYMLTKMDDIDMAMLISDGDTYLIYPAEKCYMKMSAVVMKLMGIDADEMISSSDLGFSDLKPLSEANSAGTGDLNGVACTVYTFNNENSVSKIYMKGETLLGMETYSTSGAFESGTYFEVITGSVPESKKNPPSDYTEKGMTEFMKILMNVMG